MKILLFHHSDKPRTWTTDHVKNTPTYFWFSDRMHELSGTVIMSRYIYFFLEDTGRVGDDLEARPHPNELGALFDHFLAVQRLFNERPVNALWWPEPPHIKTSARLTPVLSARYLPESMEYLVEGPSKHAGKKFKLFTQDLKRYPFLEVPELVAMLPEVELALPCNLLPEEGAKAVTSEERQMSWWL